MSALLGGSYPVLLSAAGQSLSPRIRTRVARRLVPANVLKVVVSNNVVFADDAHTGLTVDPGAKEEITLHEAGISVTEGQLAVVVAEGVVAVNIALGFVGNDLHLARTEGGDGLIEVIVFDHNRELVALAGTVADAEAFVSVVADNGAGSKVVVIDAVATGDFRSPLPRLYPV